MGDDGAATGDEDLDGLHGGLLRGDKVVMDGTGGCRAGEGWRGVLCGLEAGGVGGAEPLH